MAKKLAQAWLLLVTFVVVLAIICWWPETTWIAAGLGIGLVAVATGAAIATIIY